MNLSQHNLLFLWYPLIPLNTFGKPNDEPVIAIEPSPSGRYIELALHRDLEDYFPLEMCDAKGFCLGEEIVV